MGSLNRQDGEDLHSLVCDVIDLLGELEYRVGGGAFIHSRESRSVAHEVNNTRLPGPRKKSTAHAPQEPSLRNSVSPERHQTRVTEGRI